MASALLKDVDIREALLPILRLKHSGQRDTLIMHELGIASHSARVDVAVLNGVFAGYEIKSDVDSMKRLVTQAGTYDRVLDEMTLVTGPRFAKSARDHVPTHWGLMTAEISDGVVRISTRRKPGRKAARHFDKRSLCMMLWRDELVDALKSYDAYKGLSSKPKGALWDRLCDVAPLDELRDMVRESIKARGDWRLGPLSESYGDSRTLPANR